MSMKILFLFLALFSTQVWAIDFGGDHRPGFRLTALWGTDDYRVGDEWGKRVVTEQNLAKETPAFQRAAMATARVGGATGFYLGKFAGKHVMATNHHVYPYAGACGTVRLPMLGLTGRCETFLGTWPEVDLALFTVNFPAESEEALAKAAGGFFFEEMHAGQSLITIGFGVAGNESRQMVANDDSDCYVFSHDGEYRLMADPDRLNPGTYRAWSFAHGCDASHGDSGSAMVDRTSGKVLGIIWTGSIPKRPEVQHSSYLTQMFQEHREEIWSDLSYAVPATKIREHLRGELNNLPQEKRAIVQAIIQ